MSTLSSLLQLTEALSEQYALGAIKGIIALPLPQTRPMIGTELTVLDNLPPTAWLVDAEEGVFCLKVHRKGKSQQRIHFEELIQGILRTKEFAFCPAIIETRHGQSHFNLNDHCYWLTNFIQSDRTFRWYQPYWSRVQAESAAAVLGNFHRFIFQERLVDEAAAATEETVATMPGNFMPSHAVSIAPNLVYWMDDVIANWRGRTGVSTQFADVSILRNCALKASAEIEECEKKIGPLRSLVHGDYHPGNLLYRGDQVFAVLDFEHIHFDDPIFDLGYACLIYCTKWHEGSDSILNRSWLGSMIDAYKQSTASGFAPRCDLLVWPYIRASSCLLVSWLMQQYMQTEGTRADAYLTLLKRQLSILARLPESRF